MCCFSAGMPTPLSSIANVMTLLSLCVLLFSTSMENSTSAVRPSTLLEYLMALSTRLTQHCLSLKKSPTNLVLKCSGDEVEKMRSTPLLEAFCDMSITCSTSCRSVNTSSESSMVALLPPDLSLAPSNLAKSRI